MEIKREKSKLEVNLDVPEESYSALIDYLQEDALMNDRVELSFHFLKYHDCINRENDFLNTLANYLVYYCFPKRRYIGKSIPEITSLVFEGRNKFFNPKDSEPKGTKKGRSGSSRSGELGEIALYFLLESFFKAPQIISKMSLKTTSGENFKGSDGIHIGIHNKRTCIFYCESKINKKRDLALSDCINSVLEFHSKKKEFEVSLISNHIDIKDPVLRESIIEFLDPSKSKNDDWLEIHACFVGFNWMKFNDLEKETNNSKLMDNLKSELKAEIDTTKEFLNKRIQYPEIQQRFYFFIMPFKDIDILRSNFLSILYGNKK